MDHSPPLQQTGIGVVAPYDFALDRELWRWVPDDVSLHLTRTAYAPLPATMEMAVHISDPALVARSVTEVRAVSPRSWPTPARRAASWAGSPARARWWPHDRRGRAGRGHHQRRAARGAAPPRLTRIATVTPYVADLTAGCTFLAEAGVEVVAAAGLGLTSDIWTVPYAVTAGLVRDTDTADAQAVFISCTNLPTYDVIAPLEAELGKPVLTANQVTMWSALRVIGRKAVGPGQQLLER